MTGPLSFIVLKIGRFIYRAGERIPTVRFSTGPNRVSGFHYETVQGCKNNLLRVKNLMKLGRQ